MSIAQKSLAVIATVAVTAAIAFSFVATINVAQAATLTQSQIQSIVSLLQSFGADSATIANVQASLNGQPTSGSGSGSSMSGSCTFTRDLTLGAKGDDVTCLQNALIAAGHAIPAGATGYFGAQTQAAVKSWQAAAGVTPAAGYFGAKSRAAFNLGGGSSGGGTTTPAPVGTGLMVSAGSQPSNSLAPAGAMRVPFTRFTVTAGNDGDVDVNSVVVQRVGLGSNASFAGVVLLDENGKQLGTAKTFNSNNQATVGEKVTVPRGTTRTFTIAGNMASSLASYAGEAPGISLVSVNTSATVSGSLPIMGAYHTTNNSLTTGSVTLARSTAFASNSTSTKQLGTTGYKFFGFSLTASSAENLRIRTLRVNQVGSVSSSDLANVAFVVEGTTYPATVSADGKYYEAVLGSGVLVTKGSKAEVYVQGDIVGSGASNRTVLFQIDRSSDIYATGETYGYGASVSGGATNVTPYLYGNTVTVTGGSVTTIAKESSVAAQNVAPNVPDQPLGGFFVDLIGEGMTVQSMVFTVATSASIGGALTNVTLVDENGSVVAGPVDTGYTSGSSQTITFTDSVTLATGKHKYTLRGKINTNATGGATITVSTNPSSGWTNVKGDITGNSITLSQTSFSMNAMTVRTGSVVIGRASSPASQTIVPGGSSVLMANLQFDASQSGEDVRFASAALQLDMDVTGNQEGLPNLLSTCQLMDGATALNTGSNVLNPGDTASSTSDITYSVTLDNPLTVAKGTVKTLGVRCNVASTAGTHANGFTYSWDVQDAGSAWTFTGATSGNNVGETDSADSSVVVTVGSGTATVTTDAGSPGYKMAAAGATDVTIGALKFTATNESVTLNRIGLKLSNTASSTAGDLVKVSLYDGATKVGEAFFSGSGLYATSTLSVPVTVTKNQDKTITLKADFASIGTGEPVTFSGHLVAVNVDTASTNTEGVGVDSGTTVNPTGSSSVAGVRLMKSYPTIAADSLPSTGVADGRLLRFKVTADSKGPIGITNFAVNLATSSFSTGGGLSSVTIYGFEDSNYSNPISGVSGDGNLQATNDCAAGCTSAPNLAIGVTDSSGTATVIQIPAGTTRYFEVRASVSGATSGTSVITKLLGNTAFVTSWEADTSSENPLATSTDTTRFTATTDLIWSPNSTTTSSRSSADWANGYGVTGLPSGGLINTRSQ